MHMCHEYVAFVVANKPLRTAVLFFAAQTKQQAHMNEAKKNRMKQIKAANDAKREQGKMNKQINGKKNTKAQQANKSAKRQDTYDDGYATP